MQRDDKGTLSEDFNVWATDFCTAFMHSNIFDLPATAAVNAILSEPSSSVCCSNSEKIPSKVEVDDACCQGGEGNDGGSCCQSEKPKSIVMSEEKEAQYESDDDSGAATCSPKGGTYHTLLLMVSLLQ